MFERLFGKRTKKKFKFIQIIDLNINNQAALPPSEQQPTQPSTMSNEPLKKSGKFIEIVSSSNDKPPSDNKPTGKVIQIIDFIWPKPKPYTSSKAVFSILERDAKNAFSSERDIPQSAVWSKATFLENTLKDENPSLYEQLRSSKNFYFEHQEDKFRDRGRKLRKRGSLLYDYQRGGKGTSRCEVYLIKKVGKNDIRLQPLCAINGDGYGAHMSSVRALPFDILGEDLLSTCVWRIHLSENFKTAAAELQKEFLRLEKQGNFGIANFRAALQTYELMLAETLQLTLDERRKKYTASALPITSPVLDKEKIAINDNKLLDIKESDRIAIPENKLLDNKEKPEEGKDEKKLKEKKPDESKLADNKEKNKKEVEEQRQQEIMKQIEKADEPYEGSDHEKKAKDYKPKNLEQFALKCHYIYIHNDEIENMREICQDFINEISWPLDTKESRREFLDKLYAIEFDQGRLTLATYYQRDFLKEILKILASKALSQDSKLRSNINSSITLEEAKQKTPKSEIENDKNVHTFFPTPPLPAPPTTTLTLESSTKPTTEPTTKSTTTSSLSFLP